MNLNNSKLPPSVKTVLYRLKNNGFSCFIVGGAVRSAILNQPVYDWDIATSAKPEQVIEIFKGFDVIPTGIKHGTVTIIVDDMKIETTAYRIDGKYTDNRHPDEIIFEDTIADDLKRRDFTMNAIAYNPWDGLVDPYWGVEDIRDKVIRCVGSPSLRFHEDALRILRAMRFASQLGFDIHWQTSEAMRDSKHLLGNISKERIQSELVKILMGENASKVLIGYSDILLQIIPEMKPMVCFVQDDHRYKYDNVLSHTLHCLGYYDLRFDTDKEWNDIILRLALLLHDIEKPSTWKCSEHGYKDFSGHDEASAITARRILKRLRFSNDIVNKVCQLIDYHCIDFDGKHSTRIGIKSLLNKIGETQLRRLIALQLADLSEQDLYLTDKRRWDFVLQARYNLDKIIENDECYNLKQLAINGDDLIEAGFEQGELIGVILDALLAMVIYGIAKNDKDILLDFAKDICLGSLIEDDFMIGSC